MGRKVGQGHRQQAVLKALEDGDWATYDELADRIFGEVNSVSRGRLDYTINSLRLAGLVEYEPPVPARVRRAVPDAE